MEASGKELSARPHQAERDHWRINRLQGRIYPMKYLSTERADKALTKAERLRDRAEEVKIEAEAHYESVFSAELARQLELAEGKGPLKLAEYMVKKMRDEKDSDIGRAWSVFRRASRVYRRACTRAERIKRIYFDSKH